MGRAHNTPTQMRFGDTDALGHVNNAAFAEYAETARLDFMTHLQRDVSSIILARLAIDYKKQVLFGQQLSIETWVERVGRTSLGLHQMVLAGADVVADMHSVVVKFDYARGIPSELGTELRDRLSEFLE